MTDLAPVCTEPKGDEEPHLFDSDELIEVSPTRLERMKVYCMASLEDCADLMRACCCVQTYQIGYG